MNPFSAQAKKTNGRFYTPDYLVKNILDLAGYQGTAILQKHVIDNSCGDGAFLIEVVRRYCAAYQQQHQTWQGLIEELAQYIHAIELEPTELKKCQQRLNHLIGELGINSPVNWFFLNADALTVTQYNQKMDFVVGNPPYVRVHYLKEKEKAFERFELIQKGMTDLYLAFYELGIQMLNSEGVLAYIAPSSIFNSKAAKELRRFLVTQRLLAKVVNLGHHQPFAAITFTAILVLSRNHLSSELVYYTYSSQQKKPQGEVILAAEEYYFSDKFYFGQKNDLQLLKEIFETSVPRHFVVKNAMTTLRDDFFIGHFDFNKYVIPVVKASTGKTAQCIFPYENDKLVPWSRIEAEPALAAYFLAHQPELQQRDLENPILWHGLGRAQGIKAVNQSKFSINTIARHHQDLKIKLCPPGTGIYAGLMIITEEPLSVLNQIIKTETFDHFLRLLSRYKNQGYYTFSALELQHFLNYQFAQLKQNTP